MSVPAGLEPSAVALAAAFALDRAFGEPPDRAHPVVWMGTVASLLERSAPKAGRLRQLAFGVFIATAVPTAFAAAGGAILWCLDRGSLPALLLEAVLLKTTFSVRALGEAAARVRSALQQGTVAEARFHLRALCSRDAASLEERDLVAATVESVAENASDSFVAPVFYYVLCGLPGALFYRAVNTLDAMIGYHGRFEYLGKASARLDDLLNLVPARLTAALLLAAGAVASGDVRRGWTVLWRDGSKTESPNAGRPMAAMAGLLRVELEKPGHYRLGDPGEPLTPEKIGDGWRIVSLATALALVSFLALVLFREH